MQYARSSAVVGLASAVSPSSETRNAASAAKKLFGDFDASVYLDQEVYVALGGKVGSDAPHALIEDGGEEMKRLHEVVLGEYRRAGAGLGDEDRAKALKIKERLSALSVDFQQSLNEDTTTVALTTEELEGMPADVLERLEKDDEGRHLVTMKYPDVLPGLRKCKRAATRKALEKAYASRCLEENSKRLEETVLLRGELARLLGYKQFSDLILESRMAKTIGNIEQFYERLVPRLQSRAEDELKTLLELKAKDVGSGDTLEAWDFMFYHTKFVEEEHQVDDDVVKEYFPFDTVNKGLLETYQELFSLKFVEVEQPDVWHESVRLYEVREASNNELIGHFYLDLFPREGKYGHAAVFPLQRSCVLPDGTFVLPAAAMVANFPTPSANGRPSLLKMSEVVTYFHEFGHVMHNVLSKVSFQSIAGTAVQRDFVEAPSQMLEHWCWEASVLRRLSGHFERDGEALPEDLLERLVKAKHADVGLLTLRQVFFGKFDLHLHTLAADVTEVDSRTLYADMKRQITMTGAQEGTNGAAQFAHIMAGYASQYYGYLWSEVYAADMYSRFRKEGVMNSDVGGEYRAKILSKGNSREAIHLVRDFLGRDPNEEAFLFELGLTEA